jgi:hypothetical protein
MSGSKRTSVGWLLAAVLLPSGCGRAPDAPAPAAPPAPEDPPAPQSPPSAGAVALPKLADPLPLLDEGRVEVSPPKGWEVPSRSSKYLALFQQDRGSKYPAIILTGEDYDFPDVTAENAGELAAKLAAELSVASVEPTSVGSFVGVTYRKRSRERDSLSKIVDRLFLETVVAGRKYRLELRTREDSGKEAEPHLEAVARGVKFLAARSEASSAAAEAPSDESERKPDAPPEEEPGGEPGERPEVDLDLDDLDLDDLVK